MTAWGCQLSAEKVRCQRLVTAAIANDANRSQRAPPERFRRQAREKFLGASIQVVCESCSEHQFRLRIPYALRSRARDLARYKVLSAPPRFVVVKNALANKEAVRIPIHLRQLCRKSFGASIPARRRIGEMIHFRVQTVPIGT